MRDRKKSGGRKIVYRCCSILSTKLKKVMGPAVEGTEYNCNHCLVWNKKKKDGGRFHLKKKESVLEHSPTCVAGQKVTHTELKHDTGFVKHSLNVLNTTGKKAAKSALGHGGRLDGSVSSRTTRSTNRGHYGCSEVGV